MLLPELVWLSSERQLLAGPSPVIYIMTTFLVCFWAVPFSGHFFTESSPPPKEVRSRQGSLVLAVRSRHGCLKAVPLGLGRYPSFAWNHDTLALLEYRRSAGFAPGWT